jgi:hypothetical protein
MIKSAIKRAFSSVGLKISRIPPGGDSGKPALELWRDDPLFQQLWDRARRFAIVPEMDSYTLYQLAVQACGLSGDMAEVGVYKGGTASILARLAEAAGKQLHCFDTFAGMPETDPGRDIHRKGHFSDTSLEIVRENIGSTQNVRFYPGFFPATAGPVENLTFCFVHVDVDIYQSVKDCCSFFYPRVPVGGIMLFDDYGLFSCPGAKMAFDEFFQDKPEKKFYLSSGRCFVVKQPA